MTEVLIVNDRGAQILNQESFSIKRSFEIDAGHRVMLHGSKCRSPHGHRYKIEATLHGHLYDEGVQTGMVMDFGFVKQEMHNVLDVGCDHAMILAVNDPFLDKYIEADEKYTLPQLRGIIEGDVKAFGWWSSAQKHHPDDHTICTFDNCKLYVILETPTAEVLARHWYKRLAPSITRFTNSGATLARLDVWETPNCCASYPPK